MATSFNVNKADLAFILKQIKIAENTSIGYTPATAPVSITQAIMDAYGVSEADAAIAPFGLRTVDGTFNNLLPGKSDFGAADTLFPRLTDPVYRNEGDEAPFFGVTNTNYGVAGNVVDSDPRIISNLIVDMSIDNPGAVEAWFNNPLAIAAFEEAHPGITPLRPGETAVPGVSQVITNADLQILPNQSPDIGLSPGFNAWMTFFGQFFDHGLDLVTKGNNGTVFVPLQADDPLIAGADGIFNTADDLAPNLRFMALTRATATIVDGVAQHENTTTSFIDQNQTYTSHASHQVFLREYVKVDIDGAGGNGPVAVSTGKLLDGTAASGSVAGAVGNWAEVKAQALTMLGIRLSDFDVHNVPLLLTDQYGKFIPGANGYAQLVMAPDATHTTNWLKEGTAAGITTEGSIGTGHAFLNDIAHHAAPGFYDHDNNPATPGIAQIADSDSGVGDDGLASTYDDEMLNAHFVTGDGRGNENIALTTVHSIFHSEHNRLVEVNKATIIEAANAGDIAFLNEWLVVDVAAVPVDLSTLVWDGERLFQAARFGTEMQYQHLVFEEFARRIQPMVDPFVFNSSPEINPAITAEFAHTVYRFGHSMLTGTVDRLDNNLNLLNGDLDQKTLLAVFLNPQAYVGSGATLEEINANLIRGLSRDVGNAIDEFIVSDVRSNLLGLPLDLAVLNLSRGRETGIPSLNETRAQLYNDTGLADLKPYTSWFDFALNIKNAASVVNFIAAYGTHSTITNAITLADKRAAAEAIVFGGVGAPTDRIAFLNGTGAWAGGSLGGLNLVDLWIGGLAEKNPEFGGMLGTTFNYVFEAQMEALQFGDRLYYLTRTQGTNFLNQLEPNTFSDLVMRNTALGDKYATHLSGALFITPDHIIELDRGIAQTDYNGAAAGNDPLSDASGTGGGGTTKPPILGGKVVRDYTGSTIVDGNHDFGGYIRVQGGEHYVIGGTEGDDRIYSDSGIDTIWGDGGNDYINAGTESDDVFGGEGDDIIEDPFGDDVLRGNQGNDVITSARGADLLFGDQGNDYIVLGQDASEVFAGTGDDFVLGGAGKDFLLGNEGNDWIEGGSGFDTIAGDNSELFFNSPIIGHDVLFNQGDEGDYDAESGDDIMGSGPSVFRYEGMFGFDWGIGKHDIAGVNFDLQIPIFTTIPADVLRDRFDQTEALSGWKYDDRLDGDDRGHKGGGSSAPDSVPTELFAEHLLTQEGINRIDGFNTWFGGARQTLFGGASPVPGSTPVTTYRDGNILMGGDGNDFLRGRGGYDILDGDAWLNVRIKIVANGVTYSAESMSTDTTVMGQFAGKVFNTNPDGSPNFASPAFGGRSLTSLMLDRTLNPGQLSIVREILYDNTNVAGIGMNIDTAIFQGTMAEYEIEGLVTDGINYTGQVLTQARDVDGDGFIFVRDKDTGAVGAVIQGPGGTLVQLPSSRGALTDDRDLLKNIEQLQFADLTFTIGGSNRLATGIVLIADPTPYDGKVTPYVGQVLVPTLTNFADLDGIPLDSSGKPVGLNFEWQTTEFGNNSGWSTIQTSQTYTVRSVDPGHVLRAVAVFKDSNGVTERIFSTPTDNPTVAFSVNENSLSGTIVGLQIPFSLDYDPESFNGNPPPDVDLATLFHQIDPLQNAGGRFTVVRNGVDFNGFPRYSLVVANGGPANLDYETQDAFQTVDNQYQVIINSYDAPGGTQVAQRQFTIFLNDVNPEIVPTPPIDIQWNGITPDNGALFANGLPGVGAIIANLTTVDANNDAPYTYALVSSTGATGGFTVNATTGVVTRTGAALATNSVYTLNISSTDATGGTRTETFTIRTGTNSIAGFGGANTLDGDATDNVMYGSGGNDTLNGAGGNDTLFGQAGNDTLNGGVGNDSLVGGSGDDTINGGGGNDTIKHTVGDGGGAVNGGADSDTLAIVALGGNQSLDVTYNGTSLTNFDGGTVTNVEFVTLDMGAGTDTLVYTAAGGITVNLTTGAASGFTSPILNVENVTGGGGVDTLTGDASANVLNGGGSVDTLNGGGGADTLIGGLGADVIDTGAADDNVQDQILFNAVNEFGDIISNFDATGTAAQIDRVLFGGALNTAYDDGNNNDAFLFASGNGNAGTVTVTVGPGNGNAEALFLASIEGVTDANLLNAGAVATAFNNEFNITANNGEDALLVVNGSAGGNRASLWQWIQSGGGELSAGELTLIGSINANGPLTTNSFGLF